MSETQDLLPEQLREMLRIEGNRLEVATQEVARLRAALERLGQAMPLAAPTDRLEVELYARIRFARAALAGACR